MAEQPKQVDVTPTAPPAPQPTVVGNVVNTVGTALGTVQDVVSSAVGKGSEVVANANARYGFMILVSILIGAVLLFVGYLLYVYLSNLLTNKLTVLIPDSQVPRKGTEVTRLEGGAIPPASNGKRMSYSFWIYIHDINKYSSSEELRHVFHIGDENPTGASPSVYLDGTLNKLYVRFDKVGSPTDFQTNVKDIKTNSNNKERTDAGYNASSSAAPSFENAVKIDLATRGIAIDYIPLQRWVHVTVVVNETVNKGYISAYLDGELVKSLGSSDKITLTDGKQLSVSYQNLNLNKAGDVYIGGDLYNENINKGFSGIVSKIVISNHDLNGEEIKKLYVEGPVDNLTSKLGLPAYGLRSPIYRIG